MQDAFTGKETRIQGRRIPGAADRRALHDDHERRLEALDRLCAASAQCGVGAHPGRDLVVIAEDEISLLEGAGADWEALGEAIRAWRACLPLCRLEDFGFPAEAENPLEEANGRLRRIGAGVEAWAFAAEGEGSVYKFYRPSEELQIGSVFGFHRGQEAQIEAEAEWGDYRGLLEKLLLIHALGGAATEVIGVTPEGIVVAKQMLGETLAQGADMSRSLPGGLIEIPSRFLRANRDHPRLFFLDGTPYLIADLHARNFVRGVDGGLHVIDLVAAPWPIDSAARDPFLIEWIERKRADPNADLLAGVDDSEL